MPKIYQTLLTAFILGALPLCLAQSNSVPRETEPSPLSGRWFLESGLCVHGSSEVPGAKPAQEGAPTLPSEELQFIGTLYQEALVIRGAYARIAKLLRTGLGPSDFCALVTEYQVEVGAKEARLTLRKALDRQGRCESSPPNTVTVFYRDGDKLKVYGKDSSHACDRILFIYGKNVAPTLHSDSP